MNTLLICALAVVAIALIFSETEAKPSVPLGGALQRSGSRFGRLTPGCDGKEEAKEEGKGGAGGAGGAEGAAKAEMMKKAEEEAKKKGK